MRKTTPKSDKVWYVDYGASNHMTSHEDWFSYLEKLEQPGVVETGDDTLHTIEHVDEVPLSHVEQKVKLRFGRTDRRLGDASTIHASLVLHRERGPNYCARAQTRDDVHPRDQSRWHRLVRERTKSRVRYRLME